MRIIIESIPHKSQRYETVGDWYWPKDASGIVDHTGDLTIKVSEELGSSSFYLIAVHELIESLSCMFHGVSQNDVDKFDMNYSGSYSEPGNDPEAPYRKSHIQAEIMENLLAYFLGINWTSHEEMIDSVTDAGKALLRPEK